MDAHRNDLGLGQVEFQTTEFYNDCQRMASDVVRQMNRSKIVQDSRTISEYVQDIYKYGDLIGPTKHKYPVSDSFNGFKTSFANFLASYEFALIANATLNTLEKYPLVEVLGHFHDGIVIIVPKRMEAEVQRCFQDELVRLGREMGLAYKIRIECNEKFPDFLNYY